jgi:hypothetical protein
MAAEAASPYFRLGYNSLGAFATINHLHFQVLYFRLHLSLLFTDLSSCIAVYRNVCTTVLPYCISLLLK